jgi:hypothetical protein
VTGCCLLCGYWTVDLDDLDEHVARCERWNGRVRGVRHGSDPVRAARSVWLNFGLCPLCGAGTGEHCVSLGGSYVDPHAARPRLERPPLELVG